jgi:glucan phosphorylase
MPSGFFGFSSPQAIDPRRWERCHQRAAADMLREGWTKHAKKFGEVQRRRAMRHWREQTVH